MKTSITTDGNYNFPNNQKSLTNDFKPLTFINNNTTTASYYHQAFPILTEPEVNILVDKNRLKKFKGIVYLKECEFELEIINKCTETLGIKIQMNGKYISQNHLIIYPGQRIVLDRFIDENVKFKYTTYEVDKSDTSIQQAIKNNGDIKLEFYKEYTYTPPTITYLNYTGACGTIYDNGQFKCSTFTSNYSTDIIGNNSSICSDSLNLEETGIINKGEKSEQEFKEVSKQFEMWTTFIKDFKLLPLSKKPVEVKDLIKFCTECGVKSKKEHKFCSQCGTKL